MSAAPALPPVTDAHRQAALRVMCWPGWTLAAALAHPIRRKALEALAARIRTREWQSGHARSTLAVRRHDPATGHWRTERVAGAYQTDQPTLKTEP